MSSYRDLEIYKTAKRLAIIIHTLSLELPKFELYEQGSQVRRSSKSIKYQIVEGYGRREYKADFIKFLIYSQASNDECTNQIETIMELYPEKKKWGELINEYEQLGKQINKFIQYVKSSWRTSTQQPAPSNK